MPPRPRWTEPIVAIAPIAWSSEACTSSVSARCATAKTCRPGVLSAASIARSVAARPAEIGNETPGNRTAFLRGTTGRDEDSAIVKPLSSC